MGAIASQITNLTTVYLYSTVYSDTDQRKHQSSASLAVWGIHRGPVNSPHKQPVTWKMFPFDDPIYSIKSHFMVKRNIKNRHLSTWYQCVGWPISKFDSLKLHHHQQVWSHTLIIIILLIYRYNKPSVKNRNAILAVITGNTYHSGALFLHRSHCTHLKMDTSAFYHVILTTSLTCQIFRNSQTLHYMMSTKILAPAMAVGWHALLKYHRHYLRNR